MNGVDSCWVVYFSYNYVHFIQFDSEICNATENVELPSWKIGNANIFYFACSNYCLVSALLSRRSLL